MITKSAILGIFSVITIISSVFFGHQLGQVRMFDMIFKTLDHKGYRIVLDDESNDFNLERKYGDHWYRKNKKSS